MSSRNRAPRLTSKERKSQAQTEAAERWEPLQPAIVPEHGWPVDAKPVRAWRNQLYLIWEFECLARDPTMPPLTHLSIRRHDRAPIRDWRHMQWAKNEVCGAEREGVEIYPAESRLVDSANQYHLWVLPAGERVPFGYGERCVTTVGAAGAVQRPFEKPPADAMTNQAEIDAMVAGSPKT